MELCFCLIRAIEGSTICKVKANPIERWGRKVTGLRGLSYDSGIAGSNVFQPPSDLLHPHQIVCVVADCIRI